jgi:hypothetical protein
MDKTTVYLTPELRRRLRDAARRTGRFGHQDERILGRAFLRRPAGAPGRRDLAKPQKGSPSTCGAGAIHILALPSNPMSRFGWRRDEHDDLPRGARRPDALT